MEYYRPTTNKHPESTKGDFAFLKLALSWAVAIAIAIGLQQFVFQSYQVFGASMEPTLHQGDYLIISKLGPSWSELRGSDYTPERGDIVVFEANNTRLIKRVIGLPGETVDVSKGEVTVINQEHPGGFNPYADLEVPDLPASGDTTVDVPEDEIFVVGDNRTGNHSMDSRNQLGTVPTEKVIGSLVLRLWPPAGAKAF